MKKKLSLQDLKLKSFVTVADQMRAGVRGIDVDNDSVLDCSPWCGPTEYGTCECN